MSSSTISSAQRALRSYKTEEQHFKDYMKKCLNPDDLKLDYNVISRKSKDLNDLKADCKKWQSSMQSIISRGRKKESDDYYDAKEIKQYMIDFENIFRKLESKYIDVPKKFKNFDDSFAKNTAAFSFRVNNQKSMPLPNSAPTTAPKSFSFEGMRVSKLGFTNTSNTVLPNQTVNEVTLKLINSIFSIFTGIYEKISEYKEKWDNLSAEEKARILFEIIDNVNIPIVTNLLYLSISKLTQAEKNAFMPFIPAEHFLKLIAYNGIYSNDIVNYLNNTSSENQTKFFQGLSEEEFRYFLQAMGPERMTGAASDYNIDRSLLTSEQLAYLDAYSTIYNSSPPTGSYGGAQGNPVAQYGTEAANFNNNSGNTDFYNWTNTFLDSDPSWISEMIVNDGFFVDFLSSNGVPLIGTDYTEQDVINFISQSEGNKQLIYQRYLTRLDQTGCGYVSTSNTIFVEYIGREDEFLNDFGFPMFVTTGGVRVPNHERLAVFVYTQANTTGEGNWPSGISRNIIELDPNDGYSGQILGYHNENSLPFNLENIEKELKKGQVPIILENFDVYRKDGSGNMVIRNTNVGPHVMTVSGITEDGWIIISNWGEINYINPADLDGSTVPYNDYNIVEGTRYE